METVTSFSASLLQSLDGDTARAASVADIAITDMSDNANKMGTSMESIQAAYQGFAKQNYTMLDNLKLGYGGTKTEMERLLADASKLAGVKYNIKNLSDVYEAIHVIQTEIGITGTTAEEASKTISGSWNATKAAWQNLLIAFGSGKDVKKAMSNLLNNAKNVVKNVVPVAKQVLVGIADFVGEVSPIIVKKLPGLIQELLPGLLSAAISLVGSLIQALPDILSAVWDTIKQLGSELGETLKELISKAGEKIKDSSLAKGFSEAVDKVKSAWGSVKEFFAGIWSSITAAVTPMIDSVVNAFQSGWNLILTIWNLPAIQSIWADIQAVAIAAWEVIQTAWEIAKDFFSVLWEQISTAAQNTWAAIQGIASVTWSAIQAIWSAASGYFQMVWNTIAGIFDAVSAVLQGDFEGAYDAIKGVVDGWSDYFQGVWDSIAAVFDDAVNVGSDIVDDILEGIQSGWEALTSWVSGAWEKIKGLFTVDVKMPGSGPGSGPGGGNVSMNAIGLDYVPANNYPALLHRGEAVLTAREADEWRRGMGGGGRMIQITQNIQTVPMTPVEVAETTAAYFEMARWAV